jgi:NAD dependent epimerase/dehydratase family enzyme
MGNGKQYFSWIHETDLVRMIEWMMEHKETEGTFNCAAPHPTTNAGLMKILRINMHVPFGLPQPVWLLKFGAWLIGTETELILKSRNVVPAKVLRAGFRFEYENAGDAIADLLKK